jgi:hypothetical protein
LTVCTFTVIVGFAVSLAGISRTRAVIGGHQAEHGIRARRRRTEDREAERKSRDGSGKGSRTTGDAHEGRSLGLGAIGPNSKRGNTSLYSCHDHAGAQKESASFWKKKQKLLSITTLA